MFNHQLTVQGKGSLPLLLGLATYFLADYFGGLKGNLGRGRKCEIGHRRRVSIAYSIVEDAVEGNGWQAGIRSVIVIPRCHPTSLLSQAYYEGRSLESSTSGFEHAAERPKFLKGSVGRNCQKDP